MPAYARSFDCIAPLAMMRRIRRLGQTGPRVMRPWEGHRRAKIDTQTKLRANRRNSGLSDVAVRRSP